eukprot:g2948.t1
MDARTDGEGVGGGAGTGVSDGSESAGVVVATSGISKAVIRTIQSQIEQVGGVYSPKVHSGVTHLIARALGTEKCAFAYARGIKVVKQRWIQSCFEARKLLPTDGCTFLPLETFSICVTGNSQDMEREVLEKMITDLGGAFSRKMNLQETTHLLAFPPLERMDKFDAALEWEIPVVSFQWIEACKKLNTCIPHANFIIKRNMAVPPVEKKSAQGEVKGAVPSGPPIEASDGTAAGDSAGPRTSVSLIERETIEGAISERQNLEHFDRIFDGLRIHFYGFEPDDVALLRVLLRGTAALHFVEYNTTVTHIVVPKPPSPESAAAWGRGARRLGPMTAKQVARLKAYSLDSRRPSIVGLPWLLECIKTSSRVGISEEYAFQFPADKASTNTISLGATVRRSKSMSSVVSPKGGGVPLGLGKRKAAGSARDSPANAAPGRGGGRGRPNVSFKPLAKLTICVTGYGGKKRHKISKLSTQLGASFTDVLNHQCTHLVCQNATGDKFTKAKKWGHIHTVSMEWLVKCSKTMKWADESEFAVRVDDGEEFGGAPPRLKKKARRQPPGQLRTF